MRDSGIYIIAGVCGAIFAVIIRYSGMSPAQYIFDNYGFVGLAIYAIVVLGFLGTLLFMAMKHLNKSKHSIQAKD